MIGLIQGVLACLWGGGGHRAQQMTFHIKNQTLKKTGERGSDATNARSRFSSNTINRPHVFFVCKTVLFITRLTEEASFFFPPQWEMTVGLIWSKQALKASWGGGHCGFSSTSTTQAAASKGSPFLIQMPLTYNIVHLFNLDSIANGTGIEPERSDKI